MVKRLFIFLLVFGALIIQWRDALGIYFIYFDEWKYFIDFSKAQDFKGLISTILTPSRTHFMAVFKALLYIQYRLFGINPAAYHVVSIGLFTISTALLYRFLKGETSDRFVSFVAAAIYATNSAYSSIVSWVICQEFTVAVIFLELALLQASKSINSGKNHHMLASGLFCLLSSFSTTMGAASYLFVAVYYIVKQRAVVSDRGRKEGLVARLLPQGVFPLFISAIIAFTLYRIFGSSGVQSMGSAITLKPFLLLKGSAIMLGDTILATFGFFHISNAVVQYLQIDAASLVSFSKFFVFVVVGVVTGLAAVFYHRLNPGRKATALTGFVIAIFSSAILIAMTAKYHDFNPYNTTQFPRYKYFLFFGLIIMAAPYLRLLKDSFGRWFTMPASVLVIVAALMHMQIFSNEATSDPFRNALMKKVMTAVETSVKYPMATEPERFLKSFQASWTDIHNIKVVIPADALSPLLVDSYEKASRVYEDMGLFGGSLRYKDLLYVFKEKNDIITDFGGNTLLLKVYEELRPADFVQAAQPGITYGDSVIKVSSDSSVFIPLPDSRAGNPSRFQHLVLRIKADRASTGKLYYYFTGGRDERVTAFSVKKSILSYGRYVLSCPSGKNLRLYLEAGKYSIKDVRLYQ